MAIKRKEVKSDVEKMILTGLIISDDFCRSLIHKVKSDYLESSFGSKLLSWVKEFYETYERAPQREIQTVFHAKKEDMNDSEAESIEIFLQNLSDSYAESSTNNWDVQIDVAIDFCVKKSLVHLSEDVRYLTDTGDPDTARSLIKNFREVAKETSKADDFFGNEDAIKESLKAFDEENLDNDPNVVLTLPNAVGEMIGPLKRGWLVGLISGMKAGKTLKMMEFAAQGYLQKKKVVFVSLEMQNNQLRDRFNRRFTGFPKKTGKQIFPVWDCLKQQTGECQLENKVPSPPLLENDEPEDDKPKRGVKQKKKKILAAKPNYIENMEYTPCTYCKDKGDVYQYIPETWFTTVNYDDTVYNQGQFKLKRIQNWYGNNLKLLCFGRFDATLEDVFNAIDDLEYTDNFIPDLVVIDYPDILKPASYEAKERNWFDEIWKRLAGYAVKKDCLMVVPTQTTRDALEIKTIKKESIPEDIRKLAHVDVLMSWNKYSNGRVNEKKSMIGRVALLAHRHKEFDENIESTVLQQLDTQQPILDSYCKDLELRKHNIY